MKEAEVQKQIMDYLRLKGCLVFKHRNVGIYKQATGRYIPLSYGEKGISDIIGLTKKGQFLAVEVKRRGETRSKDGKPSKEQLEFLERVREKGGIGVLAYSLEDVVKYFE